MFTQKETTLEAQEIETNSSREDLFTVDDMD
jgi:hypothetical protein